MSIAVARTVSTISSVTQPTVGRPILSSFCIPLRGIDLELDHNHVLWAQSGCKIHRLLWQHLFSSIPCRVHAGIDTEGSSMNTSCVGFQCTPSTLVSSEILLTSSGTTQLEDFSPTCAPWLASFCPSSSSFLVWSVLEFVLNFHKLIEPSFIGWLPCPGGTIGKLLHLVQLLKLWCQHL